MRIWQAAPNPSRGVARGSRPRTPSLFSLPEEDAGAAPAPAPMPAPAPAAAAPVPAGLGDAAGPCDEATCVQGGQDVLDALQGLQLAALGGPAARPGDVLARVQRGMPRSGHAGLDGVLQAIAQRAAIELARR